MISDLEVADKKPLVKLEKKQFTSMEVFKSRVSIHATATAVIYSLVAAEGMSHTYSEPIGWKDHPSALLVLLCFNLFFWVLTSTVMKYSESEDLC